MTPSPADIQTLHKSAKRALAEGRARDAHQYCLQILKADRNYADAWFLCGVIAGGNGQYEKAVEILRNAVKLNGQRADYLGELGKYLLAVNLSQSALDAATRGLALKPTDILTLNTLGGVFSHCGDHTSAMSCFEAALARLNEAEYANKHEPRNIAGMHFNHAVSLQFLGEIDRAEQAFEAAIRLVPTFFKAHSALSALRSQTSERNHLTRLETLRGQAKTSVDQLHLGHAIAKEQEDLGQLKASMQSLRWAKALRLNEGVYDIEAELALFEQLKLAYPVENVSHAKADACPSEEPIFIVGMPRTGTTLVEQILGSHSQVFAAGELQQLPQTVRRATITETTVGTTKPRELEFAVAAAGLNAQPLGHNYLKATRPLTGHTPRFTDKLPRNMLYIGLIQRALPNAKIICLRRDPMDTCISNYRQLFAEGAQHYQYNLDLLHCGRYYQAFDQLMSHWKKASPGSIYEISYEALVLDSEAQVRSLLAFCELDWEQGCMQFHRRNNAVATPSAVQVKQGIYTSALQRWTLYGHSVRNLFDFLRDAGFYSDDAWPEATSDAEK